MGITSLPNILLERGLFLVFIAVMLKTKDIKPLSKLLGIALSYEEKILSIKTKATT